MSTDGTRVAQEAQEAQEAQAIAIALCPLFVLHRDEPYPPCTLGELSCPTGQPPKGSDVYYLYIDGKSGSWLGERCITFVTLFTNDTGKCCGIGSHRPDVEFVRYYLDDARFPPVPRITKAYYSAHTGDRGTWLGADDVPRGLNGRPLAYIARGSHGNYARGGCFPAMMCAGNDVTDALGPLWDPLRDSSSRRPLPIDPAVVVARFGNDYTQFEASTSQLLGAPGGYWSRSAYNLFYPASKWLSGRV